MQPISLANRLRLTETAVRLGQLLTARAPRHVAHQIAAAMGDVAFAAAPNTRRRAIENMRRVDPARAGLMARASFRNYAIYLADFLRFPSLTPDEIATAVDVAGVEHLREAMRGGRGAIAVGFHIGNIDLGAATLARVGYPVTVVVDRFEPPSLDALIRRQREALGLRLVPLESAAREGLRALRRNEILALLIDKPSPNDGVSVSFFGGRMALPGGAAVLALRAQAPIVPCCVFRVGDRYRAEVAPPVAPDGDAQMITQRLADVLAGWVQRDPSQWYPFRKMWLD